MKHAILEGSMPTEAEICAQLARSNLFNAEEYLAEYPDVRQSGLDPVVHYVRYGRNEGRKAGIHDMEGKITAIFSSSSLLKIGKTISREKMVIPVVMCTNSTYVPCLSVALQSLIAYASPDNFYHIHILYTELAFEDIFTLESQSTENVKIFTHCVTQKFKEILADAPEVRYISKEACLRFLIPILFHSYPRCIYLDCDIAINKDISILYYMDLNNRPLGAVCDNWVHPGSVRRRHEIIRAESDSYFNSGVLLLDINRITELNTNKRCIAMVSGSEKYHNPDQDILNIVYLNKVQLLPMTWNFGWQPYVKDGYKYFSLRQFEEFAEAFQNPAIVHYVSDLKPWNYDDGHFTAMFWRYARTSPYLDKLIGECPYRLEPVWEQVERLEA